LVLSIALQLVTVGASIGRVSISNCIVSRGCNALALGAVAVGFAVNYFSTGRTDDLAAQLVFTYRADDCPGCESALNQDAAEFCPNQLMIQAKLPRGRGPDRRRLGPRSGGISVKQLNVLSQFTGGVPPRCRNTHCHSAGRGAIIKYLTPAMVQREEFGQYHTMQNITVLV
jgi:hypothetical protein